MTCSIEDCASDARARGMCLKHWTRWRRHGDPLVVLPKGGFKYTVGYEQGSREGNPAWVGDQLAYSTAHDRLRRFRGRAADMACAHCAGAASDWAYDHNDPNELTSAQGPYSADLDHYLPLCRSCHAIFDKRVRV